MAMCDVIREVTADSISLPGTQSNEMGRYLRLSVSSFYHSLRVIQHSLDDFYQCSAIKAVGIR